MDAAIPVDAQNAPTGIWKTAQSAVSHSAHTRHLSCMKRKKDRNKKPQSTCPPIRIRSIPRRTLHHRRRSSGQVQGMTHARYRRRIVRRARRRDFPRGLGESADREDLESSHIAFQKRLRLLNPCPAPGQAQLCMNITSVYA